MSNPKDQVAGIDFPRPVPDDYMVLDAVVALKVMGPDGRIKVWTTATGSLSAVEAYGMVELARLRLAAGFEESAGS